MALAIGWIIGIAVASTAVSYVMTQQAMKKAKKAADDMAGVLINKESNIEPIPVIYGERRVGGVRVFVSTKDVSGGAKNEFLYIALAMAEGEVESITNIYIDDNPITDSKYSGLYTINVHTGADNQTYDPLLTEANAGWTSSHKLSGVAYLAIRLKWDADVFQGVPEITAVVKGRKVYDPRDQTTAWSNNPALCVRDYLTNDRYGKGIPTSAIDDDAFEDAADDCDESVTFYSGGSTGKLFECNAVLKTDETLFDNIEKMLMGCRGFLPYSQGKYGLIIDKSRSSVFAFDQETIVGGIAIAGETKENKFNRVLVKFANPDVDYQPDQAVWPAGGSSEETALLAEDNGTLLVEEVTLDTVTNYYAARDLARVIVKRSRNALRTSFQATSEALQLTVGDVVTVTHSTPGWSAKPFQVETIAMNYDGTCSVNLLEYDSTIYTYDLAAQQTVYPDTELPDPFSVVPPTGLQVNAETSVALDGTIVTSMVVSWIASTDSFVSQYDVQWSTDNSTFQSVVTDDTLYRISPVEAGATYYTRVRSINSLGVKSEFVYANQGSVGDTTAPALPTSISATAGYKSISLEWTNPSDKDFSNVEVYRATSSGGSFSEVATVGGGFGANAEFLNGGLADATTFYYKFKSVDYSGNKSAFTAEVSATTNAAAISGSDGKSTFTAPIFKRATSTPSTPTGGTFNFGTNVLTPPSGWSTTVPSGTDPIYQANFQFSISGDTGTVTAGTWSTPVVIAENGTDGTDGLSTFTFAVHKRASSAPSAPSGGSYNFTTNTITAPSGWSEAIPSGTDPVYISTTKAQISGATGTDSSLSWTAPVLFVQNGEDGQSITGAAGPRNAAGYVYYLLSSANAPSSPSATSYNFGTGAFGGLTANWSRTPPTNTGGDAKYWATSYYVTEATFGGTQTLTFGTPFASFQFDGLVTFTNLNSELAAGASSTEITTINGGLIKTGLIDANRVKIDDATIDTDGSGNLIIKAGGVGTTQMGDLQVSTIKIAGNAVNLIRTAVSTSDITLTKNAWTDIATITFTPESVSGSAQPISIKAFSDFEFDILASVNKTAAVTFRYVKNGTNIKEFNEIFFSTYLSGYGIGYYGTASGNITPIFIDTDTTVSSRSYKLQAFYTNTETGKDCTVHAGATLECVEVKR